MPRSSDDFLSNFLGRDKFRSPSKMAKSVVNHDRWDQEDAERLLNEFKEFSAAEDRLTDAVDTGSNFFMDAFYSMVKAAPTLTDDSEIRPTYKINRVVMDAAMDLDEYEHLRTYTTGDDIGSALACITMEPTYEQLFDMTNEQMKAARDAAEKLEAIMEQMAAMAGEGEDIDSQIEAMMQAMAEGNAPGDGEQQLADMQKQKALIDAAMEKLQEEGDLVEQEFNDSLTAAQNEAKAAAKEAMGNAIKEAKQNDANTACWGLDPGVLHRLPADKRIAMAKRLNNEKLRKIAELFGPMQRMAFAEQMRKTKHSRDEIYDITIGNDLARLLPMELLATRNRLLKLDFYRRYYEGQLLQYELRGTERLAKGAVIFCEDGSGSMSGDRQIWAKAVGLCLLQIARSQKRPFFAILFGGPRQIKSFDFRDTSAITPEQVIDYAEANFGGGTDFMTPLSKSLDLLQEEFNAKGEVKGDIVFATDGMCGVDDAWLKNFKEKQDELAFRVYGIIIDGPISSEPLRTISDNRIMSIQDILSGNNIREIFRGL